MSKEKVKTQPDISLTSPAHQEAIAACTEHYKLWQRNVVDRYKGMSEEEIKLDLRATAFPFAVCMENWISDFNFSSLVRNANGFGASAVYYIGNKKVDRRGMVGCHNYTDVIFLPTIDEFRILNNEYTFVGLDNVPGAIPLPSYSWSPKSLMIFGSEGTGLTPMMQAMCNDIVAIPMFGSVRSFNCSSASAVVMYDYLSKYKTQ
jgi:tRNA G18 (ribose-2'-O)-methylase SpoU